MRKLMMMPALALAVGFLGTGELAAQEMKAAEGTAVELSAQVVDLSCKVVYDLSGAAHRECAQVCADNGVTLALIDAEGNLYVPVSTAMPGSNANDKLRGHAEHNVKVKGKVIKRGGMNTIVIESVAM